MAGGWRLGVGRPTKFIGMQKSRIRICFSLATANGSAMASEILLAEGTDFWDSPSTGLFPVARGIDRGQALRESSGGRSTAQEDCALTRLRYESPKHPQARSLARGVFSCDGTSGGVYVGGGHTARAATLEHARSGRRDWSRPEALPWFGRHFSLARPPA